MSLGVVRSGGGGGGPAAYLALTPGFIAGKYYASPGVWVSGTVLQFNAQFDAIPFAVPVAVTVDRIACRVTTAGSAGAVARMGIYQDDGTGYPGALVLDAGTVATTTTGVKEIVINQTLQPGLYWLVVGGQGAPATNTTFQTNGTGVGSVNVSSLPQIPGDDANDVFSLLGVNNWVMSGETGALPSTWTATKLAASNGIRCAVRAV